MPDCVLSWMTLPASKPVDVYAAAKRMTTRAAAQVLFGVDIRRDIVSNETTCGDRRDNNPFTDRDWDVAKDLEDFGAGFFALPIPFPGTTFYKVSIL